MEIVLSILAGLGGGSILTWWLTQRFGLEIAHRHAIIEEHTKKLHEYVEVYYLKLTSLERALAGVLQGILLLLRSGQVPTQDELDLSLWLYARLAKHEEEWYQNATALILLRDDTGEELIGRLNRDKDEIFLKTTGLTTLEEATLRLQINPHETLPEFTAKLNQYPLLKGISAKYRLAFQQPASGQTLDSLNTFITHLACVAEIFGFEINMCYKAWYGKNPARPAFDGEQVALIKAILKSLIDERENLAAEKTLRTEDLEMYKDRIGRYKERIGIS